MRIHLSRYSITDIIIIVDDDNNDMTMMMTMS
jgi:hypothetical protein